jgi:hypothetical protein
MRSHLRLIKSDSGRIPDPKPPLTPTNLRAVSEEDVELQELLEELSRREARLEALRLMTGLEY